MVFRFLWVGKTRSEPLRLLIEDYLQRLKRFVRTEVVEIKECGAGGSAAEAKRIIAALRPNTFAVLLEVSGHEWSSHELAGQVESWQNGSHKEITFIIGGAEGVTPSVRAEVSLHWSLSRLTLTHEMARVVVLEQLYRGFTILHGLPYQK